MTAPLEPDRDLIEIFVDAVLRHRGTEGFISLRSFIEDKPDAPAFRISPVSLRGDFKFLIDGAVDNARRAAQAPQRVVFAPPLCVFNNKEYAREQDVALGLVLSVECDRHPHEARRQLEELLGPATVVVRSGGIWIDHEDGEVHDKLHLHWRLKQPVGTKDERAALKGARTSAARLVGGDGSNNPVCHPIRWPGSWHRKNEPRLCSIVAVEPDIEIALDTAIKALPALPATPQAHTVDDWLTFLDDRYEGSERRRAIRRFTGLQIRYQHPAITESAVRLFNEARCHPPLSNDEVHSIVDDVAQSHADALNRERRS